MEKENFKDLSFNDVPKAVEFLIDKVLIMSKQLESVINLDIQKSSDSWMTIEDLANYLPDKPAIPTIYAWVNQKLIPYSKVGKRLYFLKSEINEWLKNGRRKTAAEIALELPDFLNTPVYPYSLQIDPDIFSA